MKLSARNVLKGQVTSINLGAVNAEITVEIAPGLEMVSIITKGSCENLGLEAGKEVAVVIKASNVMIGAD